MALQLKNQSYLKITSVASGTIFVQGISKRTPMIENLGTTKIWTSDQPQKALIVSCVAPCILSVRTEPHQHFLVQQNGQRRSPAFLRQTIRRQGIPYRWTERKAHRIPYWHSPFPWWLYRRSKCIPKHTSPRLLKQPDQTARPSGWWSHLFRDATREYETRNFKCIAVVYLGGRSNFIWKADNIPFSLMKRLWMDS